MSGRFTHLLSRYAVSTSYSHLREDVVREVKRRFIDSVGCCFGAWNEGASRIARDAAESFRGSEYAATVWGTSSKVSIDWAGFANGLAVRFLDFNDTYLSREPLHPSDMIPSIFAAGEASHSSGKALITSVATAYEVGCRLCDSASLRPRGWDHVNFTMIGGVTGIGKLLNLSENEVENALGMAVIPHAAMRQTRAGALSMWKGAAASNACRNALFACILAMRGMTGPSQPFEGEMGFFKQVAGKAFDVGALSPLESLEPPSMILQTHIKYYPVEYHAQSAVDAAIQLRQELGAAEDVDEVEVETFEAAYSILAKDIEKWSPETRETADHSLPYIVAAALHDGHVWLETFEDRHIRSEALRKVIQRIRIREEPDLTSRYPSEIPNRISVRTKAGRTLTNEAAIPRGHSKNPMTDSEIEEKFHKLTAPLLNDEMRNEILKTIWRLDQITDVSELAEVLRVE